MRRVTSFLLLLYVQGTPPSCSCCMCRVHLFWSSCGVCAGCQRLVVSPTTGSWEEAIPSRVPCYPAQWYYMPPSSLFVGVPPGSCPAMHGWVRHYCT